MNILAIINPEKVEERDVVDWRTRQAARTVVLDQNGLARPPFLGDRDETVCS